MIEQSGQTPMSVDAACQEGGRYGVYYRLLQERVSQINYPAFLEKGFFETFVLCFALLSSYSSSPMVFIEAPAIALQAFEKGYVEDENDVRYRFEIEEGEPSSSRLGAALLYIALEFGLDKKERALSHLPYLFSIKEEIRAYVEAGYSLSSGASSMEEEARKDLASRLPENLYESLDKVYEQFKKTREYLRRTDI